MSARVNRLRSCTAGPPALGRERTAAPLADGEASVLHATRAARPSQGSSPIGWAVDVLCAGDGPVARTMTPAFFFRRCHDDPHSNTADRTAAGPRFPLAGNP